MSQPNSAGPGKLAVALLLALGAGLSGCVAPIGPVEVTRFHAADTAALGRGMIRVEPAPGQTDDQDFRAFAGAVMRELTRVGYTAPLPGEGGGGQIAVVSVERRRLEPHRSNPVSVGVGGSTGNYGSGVGVGIGIDLSGPPPAQVETRLAVTIRDRASSRALWEGRAEFAVRATSPLAQTALGSAKMAEALFGGFPGRSGETILVK